MQADRRLVEHEQRVDERGAERGREVDALDLAARQRARLAVEREIAEPDVAQDSRAARGSRRAADRPLRRAAAAARGAAKNARARSIGSNIRSCSVRPGSARASAPASCAPVGRKRAARLEHRVGVLLGCRAATAAPRASAARRRTPGTACTRGTSRAARGCASCSSWSRATRRSVARRTRPVCLPSCPSPSITQRRCSARQLAPRHVERNAALLRVLARRSSWHSL